MTEPSTRRLARSNGAESDDTWPNSVDSEQETLAWRVLRGLLLLTGTVVLGVGFLIVLVPGTERLIPVEEAIVALGSDYLVVAVVGMSTVGLSTFVVAARHLRGTEEANPPVVEGVQSASYPGEGFERSANGHSWRRDSSTRRPRRRLRELATRATMRADGCPRDAAEDRVAAGDWTNDPVAGRYLSGSLSADDRGLLRGGRIRRDSRAIRRTVDAIERISDGEDESVGDERGPGPIERGD